MISNADALIFILPVIELSSADNWIEGENSKRALSLTGSNNNLELAKRHSLIFQATHDIFS